MSIYNFRCFTCINYCVETPATGNGGMEESPKKRASFYRGEPLRSVPHSTWHDNPTTMSM